MRNAKSDWKAEHVRALKKSLAFFGNAEKLNREKWVVRHLLKALRIDFKEEEMTQAAEPVDVAFRDAGFQVKEMLDEGRRRTDELKNKREKEESSLDYRELLEHYTPLDVSFSEIVQRCYSYAESLVQQSRYGPKECKNIDLLCYFNWLDNSIVPPVDVAVMEVGFRSLSIVRNRYCAVAYANSNAPMLLRDNVRKAMEYFET
ncbi:MAG: hypothetical protein FD165_794 [Gammaproteobacteria bacterium]|nr:MAG: hypothetical protein FD165_794 [Gammaproteobacteria bacterium]TND07121.1 MAG: hypothetical protein FD120_289 [Gammaproteobacteria bacterium]